MVAVRASFFAACDKGAHLDTLDGRSGCLRYSLCKFNNIRTQLPLLSCERSYTYGGDTTHHEIDCWEDARSATSSPRNAEKTAKKRRKD